MTATFLLIRHAAHVEVGRVLTGRRPNIALSREGLEQARVLADLLGTAPVKAVYTSPRERAWYTAREIAEPHELPVTMEAALDEIDLGAWTGRAFDALAGDPLWAEWNERRGSARPPGGESMAEAAERAFEFVHEAARRHDGQMIVALSHCDIIRGIIARCLDLPLDHLLRFDIDPGSVSRVMVGDWGSRVLSVNERPFQALG